MCFNLNLHPGCTVWVLFRLVPRPHPAVTCSTEKQRKAERGLGMRLADIGNAIHTRTKQEQAIRVSDVWNSKVPNKTKWNVLIYEKR